jgi:cytochrome c peroxidase
MKKKAALLIFFCLMLLACGVFKDYNFQVPPNWPQPVYDFSKNPLTEEKIKLGRVLFYDPILSQDSTISCSSCHSSYNGFTHVDHSLSHGIGDRVGTRNSPVLMNLAWSKIFMWDGAVNHLDVQALAPITHPDEMNETMEHLILKLKRTQLYPELFTSAFGDAQITGERTLKALSQFMLTLVCSNSKYDSVMRKQSVFTPQEENGYTLFKKYCVSCHTEPLFTNGAFENNGLPVDSFLRDVGRYKITGNPQDSLKFKVPTLRNIEFTYPYMHDGRFKKLSEVLDHYTQGVQPHSTLSKKLLVPIVLSSNEKVDLTAFLLTLTDPSFLFNPQFSYPRILIQKSAH